MRRQKIFLITGFILIVLALLAVGRQIHVDAGAGAAAATNTRLDTGILAYRSLQEARARELGLIGQQLASDKAFVGYVAHALGNDNGAGMAADSASIRDLLEERRSQMSFDVAVVLDPAGRTIVDTSAFQTDKADLSHHPTVAAAIHSLQAGTGYLVDRGRVLQIAVTPLVLGATSEGLLLVGMLIDDRFAQEVGMIAQIDLAIIANSSDGPLVAASSLDQPSRQSLAATLAERHVLDAGADLGDRIVSFGNDAWSTRISAPKDRVGEGWLVALAPASAQLAAIAALDRELMIGGGIIGILAFAIFAAIWINLINPLERLSVAAQPILRGTLAPVDADGRGAIARIGQTINRIMGELRESRDFEAYAADLLRQRTRASETGPRRDRPLKEDHGAAGRLIAGNVFAETYDIYGRVGAGQAGVVYRALDRRVGEVVALKVLNTELLTDREHVERMRLLLRSAARVNHPNVARVRDIGQAEGMIYIASEYVRGISLRDALARTGRVPLYAGLRIARQLCAGLAAVHHAGEAHGAVNPSNVILEPGVDAKLLDVGALAPRINFDRHHADATLSGDITYLSPQVLVGGVASLSADVYALGVMLTEMFTARLPQSGQSAGEIAVARIEQDPLPPSRLWTEIPKPLEAILLRCLERDPSRRYADAAAVQRDLDLCRL